MLEQAAAACLSLLGLIWVANEDPFVRTRGFFAWVISNSLWVWYSYQINDTWFTGLFLLYLIFSIKGCQATARMCSDDDERAAYRIGNYFVGIHPRWMGVRSHGRFPDTTGAIWRWRYTLGFVGVGRCGP